MELTWSDGITDRERHRWLLLVKDGRIHTFTGEDIPGIVAVKGYDYTQNGK